MSLVQKYDVSLNPNLKLTLAEQMFVTSENVEESKNSYARYWWPNATYASDQVIFDMVKDQTCEFVKSNFGHNVDLMTVSVVSPFSVESVK